MITFSVLLSVYHRDNAVFLAAALDSLARQTVRPDEIVLVQDGPLPAPLLEVIARFARAEPRTVRVPLERNVGLSAALNAGLQQCRFDYVARMDSDDLCLPNRFAAQVAYLEQHPGTDVVGAWATVIDAADTPIDTLTCPVSHEAIVKSIWACPFIHPTVMYRRATILRVGAYNPAAGHRQDDYDLWFRCCGAGLRFGNVPQSLLLYRRTAESLKKNDIRVGWARLKTGWKGCGSLRLGVVPRIGVMYPLLRALLPHRAQRWITAAMRKFDPRRGAPRPGVTP